MKYFYLLMVLFLLIIWHSPAYTLLAVEGLDGMLVSSNNGTDIGVQPDMYYNTNDSILKVYPGVDAVNAELYKPVAFNVLESTNSRRTFIDFRLQHFSLVINSIRMDAHPVLSFISQGDFNVGILQINNFTDNITDAPDLRLNLESAAFGNGKIRSIQPYNNNTSYALVNHLSFAGTEVLELSSIVTSRVVFKKSDKKANFHNIQFKAGLRYPDFIIDFQNIDFSSSNISIDTNQSKYNIINFGNNITYPDASNNKGSMAINYSVNQVVIINLLESVNFEHLEFIINNRSIITEETQDIVEMHVYKDLILGNDVNLSNIALKLEPSSSLVLVNSSTLSNDIFYGNIKVGLEGTEGNKSVTFIGTIIGSKINVNSNYTLKLAGARNVNITLQEGANLQLVDSLASNIVINNLTIYPSGEVVINHKGSQIQNINNNGRVEIKNDVSIDHYNSSDESEIILLKRANVFDDSNFNNISFQATDSELSIYRNANVNINNVQGSGTINASNYSRVQLLSHDMMNDGPSVNIKLYNNAQATLSAVKIQTVYLYDTSSLIIDSGDTSINGVNVYNAGVLNIGYNLNVDNMQSGQLSILGISNSLNVMLSINSLYSNFDACADCTANLILPSNNVTNITNTMPLFLNVDIVKNDNAITINAQRVHKYQDYADSTNASLAAELERLRIQDNKPIWLIDFLDDIDHSKSKHQFNQYLLQLQPTSINDIYDTYLLLMPNDIPYVSTGKDKKDFKIYTGVNVVKTNIIDDNIINLGVGYSQSFSDNIGLDINATANVATQFSNYGLALGVYYNNNNMLHYTSMGVYRDKFNISELSLGLIGYNLQYNFLYEQSLHLIDIKYHAKLDLNSIFTEEHTQQKLQLMSIKSANNLTIGSVVGLELAHKFNIYNYNFAVKLDSSYNIHYKSLDKVNYTINNIGSGDFQLEHGVQWLNIEPKLLLDIPDLLKADVSVMSSWGREVRSMKIVVSLCINL